MSIRFTPPRAAWAVSAALTLVACSGAPSRWSPMSWWSPTPPTRATLTKPVGSLCLAEIAAFATERSGYRVSLTDSAFATSADLEVPLAGLPVAPGLDPTAPRSARDGETFVLSIDGKTCRVEHPASRKSVSLRQCECAAR